MSEIMIDVGDAHTILSYLEENFAAFEAHAEQTGARDADAIYDDLKKALGMGRP